MSLIDLPGMTRVACKGQPADISAKLEAMIKSYISNPSCIILAVSAANGDLANSDAIALARDVDPEGRRTIGASLLFNAAQMRLLCAASAHVYFFTRATMPRV